MQYMDAIGDIFVQQTYFYSQPLVEFTQNRLFVVEEKMSSHAMIHLERYSTCLSCDSCVGRNGVVSMKRKYECC